MEGNAAGCATREAGVTEKGRSKKRNVKRRMKVSAGKTAAIDMSTYIYRRRAQTLRKVICTDRKRGCLKSKRRNEKR
jgi:hypothetical protein